MNEIVSVIVPVYKVESYLDRCIDSIVNQTYHNLEIILVDDGSPDKCPQICDDWAAKDDRIKVIHKENAGVGMARNSGLEIATGSYLMFVDSDDYLSKNAVKVLHERMVADESDMAIGKHVDVYEDGTYDDSFCRWITDEVITKETMLFHLGEEHRFSVVVWGRIYKRAVFADIRFHSLMCGEDCYIFSTIVERCTKISIVNELVYFYFQQPNSILHQMTDIKLLDDIKANLWLTKCLQNKGYVKAAKKWFSISVDKASHLKETKPARKIFNEFFTSEEKGNLLRGAEAKTRVKWICMHSVLLLHAMRTMRSIMRRMHG